MPLRKKITRVFINKWASYVVFGVLLMATLIVWNVYQNDSRKKEKLYFEKLVLDEQHELQNLYALYEQTLWGGLGLFYASNFVDREEWKAFVESLKININLPGMNGLGYISYVEEDDLPAFIANTRMDHAPDFTSHPSTDFSDKFIIKYIEPVDHNKEAVGLDIGFEKRRREAAEMARDYGMATLTKKIILVQDDQKTPGFLFMLPHYLTSEPLISVYERRRSFVGWVYAPIIGSHFLSSIIEKDGRILSMAVYDGGNTQEENLIFQEDNFEAGKNRAFEVKSEVEFSNRIWTVVWRATDKFVPPANSYVHAIILILGVSLSVAFAGVTALLVRLYGSTAQQLVESQERFQLAVKGSKDGIWDWDISTGAVYYSGRFRELLGFEPGDSKKFPDMFDSFEDSLHQDDKDRVIEALRSHLKEKTPYNVECRLQKADRTYGYFLAKGEAIFDENDKPTRMAGSLTDISAVKQAEEELIKQKEYSDYIVSRNPGLIVRLNSKGITRYVNPRVVSLTAYKEKELIGRDWWELFYIDEDRDQVQSLMEYFENQQQVTNYEMILTAKDGGKHTISWTSLNRYDDEEQLDEIILIGIDITERNEFQGQLVKAKEEAKEANRAKSDFLAGMSHEIRTPMNGVLGTAELLAETNLDDKQKKYVSIIRSSGSTLLEIINEILDYSKIESGNFELHEDTVFLRKIVEEQIALLQPLAAQKNLSYQLEYDEKIPEYIKNDEIRLRQVMTNLIGNAIKFTDEGGEIKVVLKQKSKKKLMFEVHDTGIGIPKEKYDAIFAPFEQVISAKRTKKETGTGLGLAISKNIIEMMDGEIGFESKLGKGSKFWFIIPVKEETAENIECLEGNVQAAKTLSAQNFEVDVLVVEDVTTNQFVIMDMLEKMGCRVDLAKHGGEAVKMVEKKDYSIILMDCNMPVMDGFEATQEIRKLKIKQPPIIALTANALKGDKEKCLEAGMDDFVSKPIDKTEIIRVFSEKIGKEE